MNDLTANTATLNETSTYGYSPTQLVREARDALRSDWLAARSAGLCKGRVPKVDGWSLSIVQQDQRPRHIIALRLNVHYTVNGEKRTLTVAI